MPSIEWTLSSELDALVTLIRVSAQRTTRRLKDVLATETDGLQFLRLMKFSGVGQHPTEDRDLNIIEQINQTLLIWLVPKQHIRS